MKKGTIKRCTGCTDYECFVKFVEDGKATIIKKMIAPKTKVKDYISTVNSTCRVVETNLLNVSPEELLEI